MSYSCKQYGWKVQKYCRWCGKGYKGTKPNDRDGFCCAKCKQAHYRAYKKYVTGVPAGTGGSAGSRQPEE